MKIRKKQPKRIQTTEKNCIFWNDQCCRTAQVVLLPRPRPGIRSLNSAMWYAWHFCGGLIPSYILAFVFTAVIQNPTLQYHDSCPIIALEQQKVTQQSVALRNNLLLFGFLGRFRGIFRRFFVSIQKKSAILRLQIFRYRQQALNQRNSGIMGALHPFMLRWTRPCFIQAGFMKRQLR